MNVQKLSEIVDLQKGKKPEISSKSVRNLPYLTAKYIRGEADPEYGIPDSKGSLVVNHEDYVIIMDGSNSGEVFTGLNGILASTMGKLVLKEKINMKYLGYFLDSNKELFAKTKTGSAIPHLSKEIFFSLQIPVPPLQEQEKIVERLDKVFENIDKNQEKILNLKFLYSQMKDSFINKKLSNEKTQVLSSFSDIQYGYTPDKNSKEKIQVPILRITDIQNNKVDWENVPNVKVSQETFDKFYLKKGDILFARTGGTLGKSYLFNEDKKAIFASYLIRVTNTKSDFNPKFLKYFFESTEYWKQVNQGTIGAAQPFFNGKKLGNLKIPYSNKDEQKLILNKDFSYE